MNQLEIQKVSYSKNGNLQFPEAIHPIKHDNWNYSVDVEAKFGLAYDDAHFYLRYVVKEHHPKAVTTETNGPVWEDSCVEFFITFDNKVYYNLEFNCIGAIVVGCGANKTERQRVCDTIISSIQTFPSLGSKPVDIEYTPTEWSIDIIIPKTVFAGADPVLNQGQQFKVNFYKCGDKQKEPHFLSWNAIDNATPNFHLPAFFGNLLLK